MENEMIDGIAKRLYELFGEMYEIHIDEVKQDFKEPCFFVVDLIDGHELVMRNRYRQTHSFDIQYFPKGDKSITRECNTIKQTLLMGMEYINLGDDLIRGTDMSANVQNNVLHFFVNYNIFVFRVLDPVPKMQTLAQTQHLKGSD
jgi:hypothetical protein